MATLAPPGCGLSPTCRERKSLSTFSKNPDAPTPPPPAGEPGRIDDYTLMDAIANGDRKALDTLYQRYSGVVFALCQRIVGDWGIAEDLLVDIFFELWRRADRYDATRGAPLTYISTLSRSRAIDRKRGRNAKWTTAPEGAMENASDPGSLRGGSDPAPGPYEASASAEQADKVRQALAKVPDEHRKTLELSYFDGLSHSQIAAKLNKPLGTVKTHIRMGIIQLRDLLRTGGGLDPLDS